MNEATATPLAPRHTHGALRSRLTFIGLAISLGLAAPTLAACSAGSAEASGDPSQRAHRMVEEGATLLDVRTQREFDSGHIEGAMHIPVQELAARRSEVPQDQPVVVYCHSGARSASAASMLRADGLEVFDLGAMSSW